jgi:hypothetical protein
VQQVPMVWWGVDLGPYRDVATLQDVALRLDYMVGQITPEEFSWQGANYDHDSALGRKSRQDLGVAEHDPLLRVHMRTPGALPVRLTPAWMRLRTR